MPIRFWRHKDVTSGSQMDGENWDHQSKIVCFCKSMCLKRNNKDASTPEWWLPLLWNWHHPPATSTVPPLCCLSRNEPHESNPMRPVLTTLCTFSGSMKSMEFDKGHPSLWWKRKCMRYICYRRKRKGIAWHHDCNGHNNAEGIIPFISISTIKCKTRKKPEQWLGCE